MENVRPGSLVRFRDYIAIQSYLIDACILRDYLAEFVVNVVWNSPPELDKPRITTMSGLITKVLRTIPKENQLAQKIEAATKTDGWLEKLSHYRDLVVHTAPLTSARSCLYAVIEHITFPDDQLLPYLRLPLPTNPREIRAQRASKEHFADFKKQFDAFVEAIAEASTSIDGLDYLWEVHEQMADLSFAIAEASPIKGTIRTLTAADIIGEVRFTQD